MIIECGIIGCMVLEYMILGCMVNEYMALQYKIIRGLVRLRVIWHMHGHCMRDHWVRGSRVLGLMVLT